MDNGVNWKTLCFYTRQDCDTVVSILARNGYTVNVHEITNPLTNSVYPSHWKLMYCESSEILKDFKNKDNENEQTSC